VRLAIAAVLVAMGACALFTEDPPENVCASDEQCFRAQGEVCNLETKRCEPGPDAGVPADGGIDSALGR
jgi:hypothetical protein